CTVDRASPSLRASDAVGSRALARSRSISLVSVSRMEIRQIAGIACVLPDSKGKTVVSPSQIRRGKAPFCQRNREVPMKKVMLVGGGKIGVGITELLSSTGDYRITVADRDAASLGRLPRNNVEVRKVDIVSPEFMH